MKTKKLVSDNSTFIDKTINELGRKYSIHDLTQWNHLDRLKMFLDDLKQKVKKIEYEI